MNPKRLIILFLGYFVLAFAMNAESPYRLRTQEHDKHVVNKKGFVATPKNKKKHVYTPKIDQRALTFYIDEVPYFCYKGIYYQQVKGKGFEEIEMPESITVHDLPYGARRVFFNGYSYYDAEGMWFQPIEGGFLIVKKPQASAASYDTLPSKTYQATFGY
ncbi:MAG: hypothetical protein MJZ23_06255 [Paludibacteraceae bacterium]|nr:hypothetical protein [Paludibacteraceae bacterium]